MTDGGALERIFDAYVGGAELVALHAGYRFGWYERLAASEGLSADELADAAGTGPRFTLEWLRQQAAGGWLHVLDDDGAPPRFVLTAEAREGLLDGHGNGQEGVARALVDSFVGFTGMTEPVLQAWASDSDGLDEGRRAFVATQQAALTRATAGTVPGLLLASPEIRRIVSQDRFRAADLGCGAGFHLRACSEAWPHGEFVGLEPDTTSRRLAEDLNPQVAAVIAGADAAEVAAYGDFDLVLFIDTLHHMPHPASMLAAARQALTPQGVVAVLEAPTRDAFGDGPDPVERLNYLASLFNCLHDRVEADGLGAVGAVVRREQLKSWAEEAGLAVANVSDNDEGDFRVYVLTPDGSAAKR